jgi:hypothetical protein
VTSGSLNYTPLIPELKGKGWNLYTQFGEDGLIEGCLDLVGRTSRHCFEIGAADGRFFSNTLRLREQNWHAVLIEQDEKQFNKLKEEFGEQSTCVHRWVTDLDSELAKTDIEYRPDLGVIDVDGQDWHLWNSMYKYRPRIMLVEILPSDIHAAVPVLGAGAGQAGLEAIQELGTRKGYTLVATTHCNALFIDQKEMAKH